MKSAIGLFPRLLTRGGPNIVDVVDVVGEFFFVFLAAAEELFFYNLPLRLSYDQ